MWTVFYGGLFLLGCFLAYQGYHQYVKTKNLLEDGTRTTAIVTDLIVSQDSDGVMYSPVFEYVDRSHTKKHFKSSIKSRPAPYKIGDKVKIVYTAKDVRTISFWGLYRWSVILFMISAPLMILGGSYLHYVLG